MHPPATKIVGSTGEPPSASKEGLDNGEQTNAIYSERQNSRRPFNKRQKTAREVGSPMLKNVDIAPEQFSPQNLSKPYIASLKTFDTC